MKPANPFLVYGYYSPEYFCDREQETEKMISALRNERNLTLIAPRRIGKTGLVKHVFYRMQELDPESACFYMDIYATRDLKAFVQLLAQTVLGGLDTLSQSVLRRLTTFFKSCRPVISADERTGLPTVSIDFVSEETEQTLKEIFNYMEQSGKHCYLAIDEFQQVSEYPEKGVEALLRSYIQFMPHVHFIFAGSKMHIMQDMFASAKRPFYQSTQLIPLKEIGLETYYTFASSFFKREGRMLTHDAFTTIYHSVEGYTWYVQLILNRLYEKTIVTPDCEQIDLIIRDILEEQESVYQGQLVLLTNNQIGLMKAVASAGVVKNINANEFIRTYSLKTPSSVNAALKTLLDKELLYITPEGYRVYDRFFGMWLKKAIV